MMDGSMVWGFVYGFLARQGVGLYSKGFWQGKGLD